MVFLHTCMILSETLKTSASAIKLPSVGVTMSKAHCTKKKYLINYLKLELIELIISGNPQGLPECSEMTWRQ